MTEKKLVAIISDIHGNSWALEKVLEDIKSRGIKTILNLGDSLYGPLDPIGTYNLITSNNLISICGNQDRVIIENLESKTDTPTLEYVKSQLNQDITNWLKSLPFDLNFDNKIYCCHASPADDSTYLIEDIQPDHVIVKDNQEIESLVTTINQTIIACGHSHVPRIIEITNKIIINPGSIGLPAYDDEYPFPHKMESFTNHAKYSIVTYEEDLLSVELISIRYNYERAAKFAEKNNRNDWANWIRRGRT